MISGEKILVTGGAGRVAFPIARELAKTNEVSALARFSNPDDRDRLKSHNITPIKCDLNQGGFDGVPDDFTYVWHAGALLGSVAERDWETTFEVNAQATGRLMKHCRSVKSFLHCSTGSQYYYQGHHPLKESDPPGIHTHNYSLSKIAAESIVKYVSWDLNIPTTMIRICSAYGPEGGAPVDRLDAMVEGRAIRLHPDKPNYFNPIHEDDQILLGIKAMQLATVPPLIVNWAGSETTSAEEYLNYMGSLIDKKPIIEYTDEAYTPLWPDVTYMHEVLGRTKVHWKDGMRRVVEERYPELVVK